ncbi:major facilitator superfamily domain-containing protein [Calycina marina]|uniref:Major facilitator superfamily domain-containing protein n=1 Tax=Calycina marina TaxID=1763456 RepID=A0A9P7Z4F7_9HELO|nr:major facilitator superfamily domain-containing protein [Calycina marina]
MVRLEDEPSGINTLPEPLDNNLDLEKEGTETQSPRSSELHAVTTTSRRVTRTQSLTRRNTSRGRFSHPLSHVKTSEEEIVGFDGKDDPYHPKNWPFRKKLITTLLYGLTTMGSTWASAVYSPAVDQISEEFHVGATVSLLGISFLLCGFGLGPLLWAPLSELYGRKPAVLIPYFLAAIFSFGTATAKDIHTILITRFFTGIFGSAPVTNTGGVLGDIWSPQQRGTAIVGYAFAVVGGPTLGPVVGGAIVNSYLGWRWTEYVTGIMMMLFLILDVIILDESYPPALLVFKARRLRHETGNWALHAEHEEWDVGFVEIADKFLMTPFRLLVTPICFLVALYASFVYGIVYLCLGAIPIAFAQGRGWGPVVSELPFLALLMGVVIGGGLNILNNKFYIRAFEKNDNKPLPEARLPPMMGGSFSFAAGLFIFGWCSDPSIHWIAPCFGLVLLGIGFFTIFQSALNYLIDTFQKSAASAIAANTFLRSIFAAVFPLFVQPMFHKLGTPWASSLLGFISICLLPIPFLFYIYGHRIRKRGKYTASLSA